MDVLVHFAQAHEAFRKPEIEAVAELGGFRILFTEYSLNVHSITFLLFYNVSAWALSLTAEAVTVRLHNVTK